MIVMDIARFKIIKSKGHIKNRYISNFLYMSFWLRSLHCKQAARVRFPAIDNCLFLQSYNRERIPKVALGEAGRPRSVK